MKSFFIDSLKSFGEKNDGIFSWIDSNDLNNLKTLGTNRIFHPKENSRARLLKKIEKLTLNEQDKYKKSRSDNNIQRIDTSKKKVNKLNNDEVTKSYAIKLSFSIFFNNIDKAKNILPLINSSANIELA